MTEYKKITQKEIFVIMKRWEGGKIELVDAFWEEHVAKQAISNHLPNGTFNPSVGVFKVNLHGSMIDVK